MAELIVRDNVDKGTGNVGKVPNAINYALDLNVELLVKQNDPENPLP